MAGLGSESVGSNGGFAPSFDFLGFTMNIDSKTEDFSSMSLPELFAASDRIGNKYLTEAELQQRDRELIEASEREPIEEESEYEAYEESGATKLKRWETPRSGRTRNRRGRGGAARSRQRQKQFRALAARLK